MSDPRRGLRWRAAWLVVVAVMLAVWRLAAGGGGSHVIQIEFGMVPELEGASVTIDGVEAGTLEKRRNRTLNGFRVDEGDPTVQVDAEGCPGVPERVTTGFGAGVVRVMAEVDAAPGSTGPGSCRVFLRR